MTTLDSSFLTAHHRSPRNQAAVTGWCSRRSRGLSRLAALALIAAAAVLPVGGETGEGLDPESRGLADRLRALEHRQAELALLEIRQGWPRFGDRSPAVEPSAPQRFTTANGAELDASLPLAGSRTRTVRV